MIEYKEYKVITIETFGDFLAEAGFADRRAIWDVFAECDENNSYNWVDGDILDNMTEDLEYDLENWAEEEEVKQSLANKIHLVNLVKRLMDTGEIPNGFLLNVYW